MRSGSESSTSHVASAAARSRRTRDAARGAVLTGVIGAWILGGTAARLASVPELRGWVPLPLGLLAIVVVVGAVAGSLRGANARSFAMTAGWHRWGEAHVPADGRLYPFDARRSVTELVRGTWGGKDASRYVVGGRVLVHAIRLPRGYDPVQWVPNDLVRRVTLGKGRDVAMESHAVNAAFRLVTPAPRSAHAVMAPHVTALFDQTQLPHTIVALDGNVMYTADDALRLGPADSAMRLDFLSRLADVLPTFLDPGVGSGSPAWEDYFHGGRRMNIVGRMAVWLAVGWVTAPFGIIAGLWALRLVARGRADNPTMARVGIGLSGVSTATFVWAIGSAWQWWG